MLIALAHLPATNPSPSLGRTGTRHAGLGGDRRIGLSSQHLGGLRLLPRPVPSPLPVSPGQAGQVSSSPGKEAENQTLAEGDLQQEAGHLVAQLRPHTPGWASLSPAALALRLQESPPCGQDRPTDTGGARAGSHLCPAEAAPGSREDLRTPSLSISTCHPREF